MSVTDELEGSVALSLTAMGLSWIVDPRRHDLADAGPKWSALAKYAQDDGERVRRVIAVIEDASGELRALDLTKDGIGPKVEAPTNRQLMENLFAAEGMAY